MLTFRDWMRRYGVTERATAVRCAGAGLRDLEGIERFLDLEYLDCSRNALRSIPHLDGLVHLAYINISHNRIDMLPRLPQCLTVLDCAFNAIESVAFTPHLPRLQQLLCASCLVQHVGDLTKSPIYLMDFRNNNLAKTPKTPATLIHGLFDGNPIEDEDDDASTSVDLDP